MRSAWSVSVVAFVAWLFVTLGGEILQARESSLEDLVSHGIVWSLVVAIVFLLVIVAVMGWARETELIGRLRGDALLFLPPIVAVATLVALALVAGMPRSDVLASVLVNTLYIGISEELMFRGVLFHGAETRYGLHRAIWITVVLFGASHALNGFLTGQFAAAAVQAVLAAGMGTWMAVLRVRVGTLVPLMVLHWLWDFAVLSAAGAGGTAGAVVGLLALIYALMLAGWGYALIRRLPETGTAVPA